MTATHSPLNAARPSPPPADARAWEKDLVDLLGRLEHAWGELAALRLGADRGAVLDRLAGMVEACDGLAGRTEFPAKAAAAHAAAVAEAGAFMTAAAAARATPRGVRGLWGLFDGPADPAPARECLAAAAEALKCYFALFTDRFPTSASARGWVDAASGFLTDVHRAARERTA